MFFRNGSETGDLNKDLSKTYFAPPSERLSISSDNIGICCCPQYPSYVDEMRVQHTRNKTHIATLQASCFLPIAYVQAHLDEGRGKRGAAVEASLLPVSQANRNVVAVLEQSYKRGRVFVHAEVYVCLSLSLIRLKTFPGDGASVSSNSIVCTLLGDLSGQC